MDFNRYPYAALFAALALTGCASKPPDVSAQTLIDQQILEASQKIEAAQVDLYQAGALNSRVVMRTPSTNLDDKQFVTISWQGDAIQLLTKLAQDRGERFEYMGLRMPLPVNIDVKGVQYESVLAMLRSQIGYRAVVTRAPGKLVLQYNQPQS
jgi:defect-in-organelle-trafficking protein DotD